MLASKKTSAAKGDEQKQINTDTQKKKSLLNKKKIDYEAKHLRNMACL